VAAVRLVNPAEVMDDLLATVLMLRQYVLAGLVVLALGTLSTIALVFSLSIRLRRAEIATMTRIGATPARVSTIMAVEILLVLLAGVVAAGLLTMVVTTWDEELFRWMLLSQTR